MDIYIPSSVLKDRHSTLRPHQRNQTPQNIPPIVVVSTVAAECTTFCPTSSTCTCAATCPTHARYSPLSTTAAGAADSGPHLYRVQRSDTNNYHLAEEEERFDRRNSEDEADEREYQEYKRLRKLKKQHKKEAKQMKALEKREKKEDKKMKKEMAKNEKEMRKKRLQDESNGGEDRTTGPTTIAITTSASASVVADTATAAAAAVSAVSDASAVATVLREQHHELDGEEWSRGGQSTARRDATSRVRRSRVASWFLGKRKEGMASMQYQELELEPVRPFFDQGKGQGGEHGDGQELQLPQQQHQQQPIRRREGTLSDLKVIPSQHHHSTLYSRKASSSVSLYLDPSSSATLHPNHQPYNALHQGPHRQSQLSSAVSEPHLGGGGRLGSGRKRTTTGCYLQRVWCKIRQSHKSASRLMMTPGSLQGDESSLRKDL